ncbi:MAG TPA: hypothetical protein VG326_20090, partial [Tepidisphaeraceae bacterium]|nr:hypothetical protein [Tepidisphaeraceae bacterium]
ASAARTAALAAGAWAIALPTLMLIFPQGIGDHLTWNLVFPRAVQGQRRAFVDALKSAPRPMLIDDSMIAQPWLATGDTYPALVTDSEIFMLAQQKGLIPKDVRSQLVLRGVYRSAVAPRDSDIALALIARGFSSRTLPIYVSPWGSTGEMVLLIRPADQTHAPATR